jgi:hypothetical protein
MSRDDLTPNFAKSFACWFCAALARLMPSEIAETVALDSWRTRLNAATALSALPRILSDMVFSLPI